MEVGETEEWRFAVADEGETAEDRREDALRAPAITDAEVFGASARETAPVDDHLAGDRQGRRGVLVQVADPKLGAAPVHVAEGEAGVAGSVLVGVAVPGGDEDRAGVDRRRSPLPLDRDTTVDVARAVERIEPVVRLEADRLRAGGEARLVARQGGVRPARRVDGLRQGLQRRRGGPTIVRVVPRRRIDLDVTAEEFAWHDQGSESRKQQSV